jgi:hypothetical protein
MSIANVPGMFGRPFFFGVEEVSTWPIAATLRTVNKTKNKHFLIITHFLSKTKAQK